MTDSLSAKGPLGRIAARGAAFSFAGQAAKIVVQLLGLVILSRLLGPEEYGLLAMVVAVVGIGELLRDFGLSAAAVQTKTLSEGQQSNLFWINTSIGFAFCLVVIATSSLLADFYDRPALKLIAICLSVTFLASGFSTQFRVKLNRDLRFGALAVIDVGAHVLGIAAAAIAAIAGLGVQALVLQLIVQTVSVSVLIPFVARWWPGRPRRGEHMSDLLKFGANVAATQLVAYLSRNVDSVVIGVRFGSVSLGLYDRAFQVFTSPLNQIQAPATNVALPVLARTEDDDERYSAFLLRGQLVLMHVLLAAFAVAWANALWLMNLVFGEQWTPAVPYLQILLIAGAAQVASYATYWVFLSKGLPGANLRFTIVSRLLTVALILVGSLWSPIAVAWGFALGTLISWPLGLWWISRLTTAPVQAMFWSGVRACCVYGTSAAIAYLVPVENVVGDGIMAFFARVSLMAVGIAVWFIAVSRVRTDLTTLVHTAGLLRRRKAD
ncbi:lipopolysaccharide biosynthesis protein [Rhodococcus sp. SORGH_AS_0303]|uniref:lipopolysaccharide biosynthesis protein n=1 Tax=Rhodococcus sp. SORGH_AS_0303 TaxID=3041753 RepID=UPI0027880D59|nr:lipopolysaccharide biosynthesis protein [Rhodococcus sp. SORGH_AS_0303]MDQ1202928.1 PST family polysaccharide transporter [Rhodococcus sp. SORGH_AS_0303]